MCLVIFNFNTPVLAQEEETSPVEEVTNDDSATAVAEEESVVEEAPVEEIAEKPTMDESKEPKAPEGIHQIIKQKFIEGKPEWMAPVLICLIIGLAFCIERIITVNLATTSSKHLLRSIEDAIKNGNVDEAKEICKSTRGPVASIFYQGLERQGERVDQVEKSIVAYGSVQMGLLEKGLVWISLFISLAPMLGFMGTVIGMILAFDDIAIAQDISPGIVAGGIKVALLTTVFGLIVAIILQIFYNYIVSKIDDIVNDMEDASITFVDILVQNNIVKKD